ncbi:MAG: peptidylprolyl isomerase, partial [Candidatus Bathyarchaeia archaeon]
EKAFGPRDPNKVRLVPLKRFSGQKVNPVPGLEVEIDGKIGIIRSVGAGRVQVDLNPPLAGRTLIYDLEVKRVIDSREEKIRALVHRRIPNIKTENMQLSVTEKQVTVHIPEEAFFLSGLQLAKKGIAVDLEKFFPELETVEFIERHVKKAEAAKPAEAEPPPSQAESST